MIDEQRFSSDWTGFHKYVVPAPVVVISLFLSIGAVTDARSVWMLIPIGLFATVILWFSVPLKWLRVDGPEFVISNGVGECRAPISSLSSVRAYRWWRVRTIYLRFDPPTRFGSRIAIIPPVDLAAIHFDRIASILAEIVRGEKRKTAQPGATDNPDDAQRLREDH